MTSSPGDATQDAAATAALDRRRLRIWLVGVAAYAVALFERYSLGVASLDATERFGIGSALLAAMILLQLLVYAAMQIPVGVLLDRYGSKRLVVTGLVLMAAGQASFAVVTDPLAALASRLLLGLGDALIFISVIRLVANWYPPLRNPVMVQVTGVMGQLGAVAAAGPLLLALKATGWRDTFLFAAALAVGTAAVAQAILRDCPRAPVQPAAASLSVASVWAGLKSAWSQPGTRLGLWTHFVAFFPGLSFAVLW